MTNIDEESEFELKPVKVYIGLGSNLGDREANLREAIERIRRTGIKVTRRSSIYETEPVGFKDQSWFLNQVIESLISPEDDFGADPQTAVLFKAALEVDPQIAALHQSEILLSALLGIEDEMGRERNIPNGPRLIDIDLLLFGNMSIARAVGHDTAGAYPIIPHPRIHERRFVLEPLCEIAPAVTWPESDMKFADTLEALEDTSVVRLYKKAV